MSSLIFPLNVLSATSPEVAAFVCEDEFRALMERGAVFGVGSRTRLKAIRFVSQDAELGHSVQTIHKSSDPTRAIASVDLERSDSGTGSYVMRRLTDDGQLVKRPEFRRAA